jgi:hypothetical protein
VSLAGLPRRAAGLVEGGLAEHQLVALQLQLGALALERVGDLVELVLPRLDVERLELARTRPSSRSMRAAGPLRRSCSSSIHCRRSDIVKPRGSRAR